MTPRRHSKLDAALLISLCAGALSLPLTSVAADPDYNTRGSSGSSSSSSDMPASGPQGTPSGDSNMPSSTSGTTTGTPSGSGSSSDMDTNRPSSGSYVKDSYITAKVKAALARDKEVTARNIRVETDGQGMVTLSGQAKSQAEVDKAIADARSVEGVTSVTSNIQVR